MKTDLQRLEDYIKAFKIPEYIITDYHSLVVYYGSDDEQLKSFFWFKDKTILDIEFLLNIRKRKKICSKILN